MNIKTQKLTVSRFFDGILGSGLNKITNEDIRRRAFILNIILLAFVFLSFFAQIVDLANLLMGLKQTALGVLHTFIPLLCAIFFITLIKISLSGHSRVAAVIFLGILLAFNFQTSFVWGVDVPQTIVIYSLVITMSGILVGPKFALGLTGFITLVLAYIFFLQTNHYISARVDWKLSPLTSLDLVIVMFSYFTIAIVSWLFSREISNSLKRAKRSEKEALNLAKELQIERDSLEIKVEERTKELRESQLRELTRINNLAEFGKLSAGLLHDIKNPLTVISLNLDSLRNSPKSKTIELINRSLLAAKTAETIIKSSQKQLVADEEKQEFDLIQEIKNTLILVEHRAEREMVHISFDGPGKLVLNGYPAKLSRVVANLVMNAIDSFNGITRETRKIEITVTANKTRVLIEVKDNGCGIKDEDKLSLFQPLFSKKENKDRMGLGLYGSKKIIKDYFGGDIIFESVAGEGTKFSVNIPIK